VGIVDVVGAERDERSLQTCLKSGKVKRFDNIADLAAEYGIPPGPLKSTVNRYNRLIAKGARDEFEKPLEQGARTVSRGPFYALRLWPKVHYTSGGVAVDDRSRVMDAQRRPIPGLFAAGEVCGGFHGASRLGGCALPECIVFGRIAGQMAASLRFKA
jgi:succinate dehydrogenase/fumarate reductase flavoprotein subunit